MTTTNKQAAERLHAKQVVGHHCNYMQKVESSKQLTVTEKELNEQLIKQTELQSLQSIIDSIDAANEHLLTHYCAKTGRTIGHVYSNDWEELVLIHGKNRAIKFLQQAYTNHVSPQWLCTDPEALRTLSNHDPIGYFIYSLSLILHNDIQESKQHDYTIKKNNLLDKIQANSNLNLIDSTEVMLQITTCNKLIQKFYCVCNPNKAALFTEFRQIKLSHITKNINTLTAFTSALRAKFLRILHTENLYKFSRNKARIDAEAIANLRRKNGSMSNYRQQNKIAKMRETDAILDDINEIFNSVNSADDIETTKQPLIITDAQIDTLRYKKALKLQTQQTHKLKPTQTIKLNLNQKVLKEFKL